MVGKAWRKYDKIMYDTLVYIKDRAEGNVSSLLTKWKQFNQLGINGVEWNAAYTLSARPGVGKALALDTKIPTPFGYTTMKDIQIGDVIYDKNGQETTVNFITDVMYDKKCYKLTFCDSTEVVCCSEHLWETETRAYRKSANQEQWLKKNSLIKNTDEIFNTFRVGSDNRLNHCIPTSKSIIGREFDLPIHPYVLGYWLGNGSNYSAEVYVGKELVDELINKLNEIGYYYNSREKRSCYNITVSPIPIKKGKSDQRSLNELLRTNNLLHNKHIPKSYFRASINQRIQLLNGLLDSDGYCDKNGLVQFSVVCKQLAYDFKELVASLGYKPTITTKNVKGRNIDTSVAYIINFTSNDQVFTVKKRANRIHNNHRPNAFKRFIVNIEEVESVPVKCIQVNNDEHMYLITESFIPTHNTLVVNELTRSMQQLNANKQFAILHFQYEMLGRNLVLRELSGANNLNIRYLQSAKDDGMPKLSVEDFDKLKNYVGQQNRNEYIVDKPHTVPQMYKIIKDFYEEMKMPFIITLDHTLLIPQHIGEKSKQDTLQNFAVMTNETKNHFPCTWFILSQMNREIDNPERQKPGSLGNYPDESCIYGSDFLQQCSDVVIAYNRPAKYNLSVYGPDKFIITPQDKYLLAGHVLKNRFGTLGIQWYKAEYAKMTLLETEQPAQQQRKI